MHPLFYEVIRLTSSGSRAWPGQARLWLYRTLKYAVGWCGDQRLEREPHEHATGRNMQLAVLTVLGQHPGELMERTHAADQRYD